MIGGAFAYLLKDLGVTHLRDDVLRLLTEVDTGFFKATHQL